MNINLLVVDLSHWDPAQDYNAVKASGVVGVIYKSTQGISYRDNTYLSQRKAALNAGLLWGCYHFGDGSDPQAQAQNFLTYSQIDGSTLFALDFEDNQGSQMKASQACEFIQYCEDSLGRPNECVFYSGNTVKDQLGNQKDPFLGARRLWLAQYGNNPTCQASWDNYWLWQYTDGQYGPKPHTVDGCDSEGIDCNHYDGSSEQLCAEWANGTAAPPVPPEIIATVKIYAPPGIQIQVFQSEESWPKK